MAKNFRLPKGIFDAHNHLWGGDDGSRLVRIMDSLGIERALVMGTLGRGNDTTLAAVRAFPDRLIGGAYYDPRDGKKAVAALNRWAEENFRIVKLVPNYGYSPDDPKFTPFFDRVAELKLGVLAHCGWSGGSKEKMTHEWWAAYYATPGRFEKVVRTHPDTVFIMAHMGGINGLLESVMLTTRTPNVYVDCSPGQGIWALEKCGAIAGSIPPEKLLWGADGEPWGEFLERYKTALVNLGYGPHLDKIFRENAKGIFQKLGVVSA